MCPGFRPQVMQAEKNYTSMTCMRNLLLQQDFDPVVCRCTWYDVASCRSGGGRWGADSSWRCYAIYTIDYTLYQVTPDALLMPPYGLSQVTGGALPLTVPGGFTRYKISLPVSASSHIKLKLTFVLGNGDSRTLMSSNYLWLLEAKSGSSGKEGRRK